MVVSKSSEKYEIKLIPIEKIKERHSFNRRSQKSIDFMKQLILKIGITDPIILNKNYRIIDGQTRYLAAKELGIKELHCLIKSYKDLS